ncbi:MAG: hypothetical protein GY772_22325 [bacterium]|nr:hypothetical protein [bacterium]
MKVLVESKKGGPPVPIPQDLLRKAFEDANLQPQTLFIDARCFTEFDRDVLERTRGHLGFHPEVMHRLAHHPGLRAKFELCARAAVAAAQEGTPLSIAVFCKVGEMRSVAFATLLSVMLRRSGWEATGAVAHLSKYYWRYRTCQADPSCEFCGGGYPKMRERAETDAWETWIGIYQAELARLRARVQASGSGR